MVSHRRNRRMRAARIRGLLLSYRDILVLAVCAAGLLAAWLVYGVTGTGDHGAPAAGEPTAIVLSGQLPDPLGRAEAPATGTPAPVAAPAPTAPPAVPLADGGAAAAQPAVSYPAASAPQRLTYPAAGMDVVVRPLEPESLDAESHSIVPPETMDGYWLTPFGTPGAGSTNTTYVIGHSWEGLDAPFNHLSSAAAAGDELTVATAAGTMTYTVESVTTYTKATLKDSPIWTVAPNRLVLISCYTEDPWGKNVAVVASPVPGR
ncbi:class F sortase [Arthrobacter sp. ISL-69]|uniref:class F sortase n=1 Tax=Arthrobacter sp. ISL-69 TaxID=2819113 RepID=UPI001BE53A52|nr:class F sortase [Arthrobacter sp. ISL-69]MBT2536494.1 class F sortase [Arthrobacter sp. ISL-69]